MLNDFFLVKDRARVIGFHDIANFKTPGTIAAWHEIRQCFGDGFDFYEFLDQYPELRGHSGARDFFGIGLAVSRRVQAPVVTA